MPSPNKEEPKLEPRTTHVSKIGHEKNPKGYEISNKTWDQSNQPTPILTNTKDQKNSMARKGRGTIWIGRLDQFEISICGSNANIRMSYK